MNATVITEATGLKIWPTSSILSWLNRWTEVYAAFDRVPVVPDITPGSLKVTDEDKDGSYRKTITFRVPETAREAARRLLNLSKSYIVASYTDERGVQRLMGCCMWPATISLKRDKGSLQVTLSGWGDAPNPEFIMAEHPQMQMALS